MPRVLPASNEVKIYRFHPTVLILVPFIALVIQTYLPSYPDIVNHLDLPLLVIIYFGLALRSPVGTILGGAIIGMAQDSLSRGPIGLLGISKSVIGYVTTFLSVRFAVEHRGVRFLTIFILYWLHLLVLYFTGSLLLGQPVELEWGNRLGAALVNSVVGVVIFEVLDRFRKPA